MLQNFKPIHQWEAAVPKLDAMITIVGKLSFPSPMALVAVTRITETRRYIPIAPAKYGRNGNPAMITITTMVKIAAFPAASRRRSSPVRTSTTGIDFCPWVLILTDLHL